MPYQAYDAYISSSDRKPLRHAWRVSGQWLPLIDVRYANRAYIKHGENGWLIPQNDANQYIAHLSNLANFGEKECDFRKDPKNLPNVITKNYRSQILWKSFKNKKNRRLKGVISMKKT